ncbi:MAG: hypothetical protein FWH18_10520 [Marinilabiliaceae bacterium]|nr:hypothetical protein [Marinilabiliaceae bacterium]
MNLNKLLLVFLGFYMLFKGKLTSGIYTYLLIGDDKTSDAKQMILTK